MLELDRDTLNYICKFLPYIDIICLRQYDKALSDRIKTHLELDLSTSYGGMELYRQAPL